MSSGSIGVTESSNHLRVDRYNYLYPSYYNIVQATSLVETLLYGGYMTIFYRCIQVLNTIRRKRDASYSCKTYWQMPYLYGALVMLFLITTINLVTTIFCSFKQIYVDSNDELVYLPTGFVLDRVLYPGILMLKAALFVIAVLISDSVLVFRYYVVFNKCLKVALFPIMAFLVDIAAGCLLIYGIADASGLPYPVSLTISELNAGATYDPSRLALYSITLVLNIMCTSLITFRIWKIQRQARQHSPRSGYFRNTVSTIVESGFIYSTWIAILLGTFVSGSTTSIFFQDSTVQIIAITFSVIISRMGRGIDTVGSGPRNKGTGRSSTSTHIHMGAFLSATSVNVSNKYANSQEVQVAISRDVWHEDDIESGDHVHVGHDCSYPQTSVISTNDDRVKSEIEFGYEDR